MGTKFLNYVQHIFSGAQKSFIGCFAAPHAPPSYGPVYVQLLGPTPYVRDESQ